MKTLICFPKVIAVLAIILSHFIASATVYNVSNTADGIGLDQFRGAILDAGNTAGPHIINVAAGTYILSLGSINFGNIASQNITIIGAGSSVTVIKVNGATAPDRIFLIGSAANIQIMISGLSFQGGRSPIGSSNGGGAILVTGGADCLLSISQCDFTSNSATHIVGSTFGDGGAICCPAGANLAVSGTSFVTNASESGRAGAISYVGSNCNITSCTFKSNSIYPLTLGSFAFGGAINLEAGDPPAGQPFSVVIQKCLFQQNMATAPGGGSSYGGAIWADCSSPTNVVHVNFNSFGSDQAVHGSGVSATGNVDGANNWWGANESPFIITGTSQADKTDLPATTPYLIFGMQVSADSICEAAPYNTCTVQAGFLKNSAGQIMNPANLDLFSAANNFYASLSGGGNSTISGSPYSMQNGFISGTLTAHPFPGFSGGPEFLNSNFSSPYSGNAIISSSVFIKKAVPALAATTVTFAVNPGINNIITPDCHTLFSITPSGAAPVSGNVTATVWVEPTVPSSNGIPFVARHYEITPAANASSATATVTLYFTSAEFIAFNSAPGSTLKLPTDFFNSANKTNLRIGKYSGVSNDGTGLPYSYTNGSIIIDPDDANIVNSPGSNIWSVTFDVSGFSGFFVQTSLVALPVRIVSFTGHINPDKSATLIWNVAEQSGISKYVVEKSVDGIHYTDNGTVTANNPGNNSYTFTDPVPGSSTVYYRLRIIEQNGNATYSNILTLHIKDEKYVSIYPNPVTNEFTLETAGYIGKQAAGLFDVSGRLMKNISITGNRQTIDISDLTKGLYFLKLSDGSTYRVVKQ